MQELFLSQRKKYPLFKMTSSRERIKKLEELKEVVTSSREDLKEAIYQDFRKPHTETDLTEILPSISCINFLITHLDAWMKEVKVKGSTLIMGTSSYVRYEARGQILVISPWNYPVTLSLIPVAEAFAAGNAVILKPSEFTPHTNKVLKKIFESVFKNEEVIVIEGDASVSTELLKLPFHHIFFTGSTAVGKVVMEAAAKNLSSITLELGGKSPCIIDQDTDMPDTVKKIVWGKYVNAGQTCIAPDFVLVPESRAKEFLDLSVKAIQEIYADDKNMAHIISARHLTRLRNLTDEAIQGGAELICGNLTKEGTNYLAPTILFNPKVETKIMQEEIFGPIMPVIPYKDSIEAVNLINSMSRPLALYIFSNNENKQQYFMNHIISGGVGLNEVILQISNHHLPFGGVNHSGIGNYHGEFGFKTFSHERGVIKRNLNLGVDYFYPPYTKTKQALIDSVFKKLNRFL
ncbi:MAG: aldehyde dehydrogenase family protein [Bacteriovoracaceae bacterium]